MTSLFIERSTERTTAAVEDGGTVEEAVLEAGLEGYADYKRRVKYRVIPHIW